MYILMVDVHVKPEHREEFVEVISANAHGASTTERGCLRFDVVQHGDDPNHFFFYEVYRSEADLEAHRQTAHFQRYIGSSQEWMAQPASRSVGSNVYPPDDAWR